MFNGKSIIIGISIFLFVCAAIVCFFIANTGTSYHSEGNTPANTAPSSDDMASFHAAPASASSCEMGQFVTFGRYPQNNGDTPDPIEWLVLDKDDDTALLISRFCIDCKPFHPKPVAILWSDCDLRKWLNDDFLNQAFTFDEQRRIAVSNIYTGDNLEYGTKGCGETFDQVFCLSIEEAYEYFASNDERKCQPTIYAVSHNVWKGHAGNCFFWLRSPGSIAGDAAGVLSRGAVASDGNGVNLDGNVVRPALRIIL